MNIRDIAMEVDYNFKITADCLILLNVGVKLVSGQCCLLIISI